ncbi:MAG: 5-formyltetrahydrofolate cyclo-ligase [Gammaproteobacteria bacterium]|nr:5-formyltetrahydrofolate cyclo-ligase [Gammaproteobacteria bacterium]
MSDRQDLRKAMRARRAALSPEERAAASAAVAKHLLRLPAFQRADRVGAYLAVNGEIDLAPVIEACWERGKTVALPVLHGQHLEFLEYTPDTPMLTNRFGIPEPDPAAARALPSRFLNIVLAPLVAFDTAGGRLGMGGGFYDRSFAFLQRRQYWMRPAFIGMAYEFQRVDALPTEPWDVPLHGVVTDAQWHPVKHQD